MPIIPKNNEEKNKKVVCTLNDLEKRKVVEHNALIQSVAKMQKTALKMFELAVSCIDTENLPENNTVYLSKKELFSFFEVSSSSKHSQFKEAIEFMQKQAYFKIRSNKALGIEYESIVPIPYVKWNDYNDEVTIQFSEHIMPYLINLKAEFTQYKISELQKLNSKYSLILYRWLSMQYNQYEHYSVKGGRRAEQVEAYRNPSIPVKELRVITDTVNDYVRFQSLETWVLKKPLEEINAHTSFNVTYDKIKKGENKKWVNRAFIFLVITCWVSIFIGLKLLGNLNILWILILFFVGLHFLFFIPANENKKWQAQVIFVILLTVNTLLGLCLYSNQIETIFIIDGLIKMGYGAYMVKTTYKVNSENLS
ncbi:replication initiation protein [Lactococcus lactis]|uniref:Replication initiation protein n=1 Tax=Lactococcus lactis subsp. lactis TaxID=1360 RepID=A0AAJ6N1M5_LACLL|nr:replication initiation protein [Lactococcus lactis]WNO28815.1 replication initiation protein [Lactococcus lactis subsp. lactis]